MRKEATCLLITTICGILSFNCNTSSPLDIKKDPILLDNNIPLSKMSGSNNNCPEDMVEIKGDFCPGLVEICLKWIDKPVCGKFDKKTKKCLFMNAPMKCAEFKKPSKCISKTVPMNFCIDKFEFPNKEGVKPSLRNTWFQAKEQCENLGKRLCVDTEWTQACRGNENLPYPYGYKRDSSACNIDLPWQDPTTHTFEQLDKTVPAGSMPKCVSPYGVYDMTGNGDEFCKSSGGTPYKSVLKGGHPFGVRNRCTSRTESHNEYFSFYDTSFRCCKDI